MGPLHHGGLKVVVRLLRVFLQQKLHAFYDAFSEASSQTLLCSLGFAGGSGGKESVCKAGDLGLIPGSGRSPGLGEFHGQRSLMGYSPWGHKESDTVTKQQKQSVPGNWSWQQLGFRNSVSKTLSFIYKP